MLERREQNEDMHVHDHGYGISDGQRAVNNVVPTPGFSCCVDLECHIPGPNVTDEELKRELEASWNNKGRPLRLAVGE